MSQLSNINYSLYRESDGEIVESGSTNNVVTPQEGFVVLENVIANPADYYVSNGQLTEYSAEQKDAKADVKRNCYWSNVSFSWVSKFTEQEEYNIQCNSVKAVRDTLLSESDWVVIKATDTGTAIPANWQEYRQSLRDVTKQQGYPSAVVWPTKPTE